MRKFGDGGVVRVSGVEVACTVDGVMTHRLWKNFESPSERKVEGLTILWRDWSKQHAVLY